MNNTNVHNSVPNPGSISGSTNPQVYALAEQIVFQLGSGIPAGNEGMSSVNPFSGLSMEQLLAARTLLSQDIRQMPRCINPFKPSSR